MKSTLIIVPIISKTDFFETVYSENIKHDPEYSIVQKSVTRSKTVEEYNVNEAKKELIKFSISDVLNSIKKFRGSTIGIGLLMIITLIYWISSDSETMRKIGVPIIFSLLLIWLFFNLKKIFILGEAVKLSEKYNGKEESNEKKYEREESKNADSHGLHGTITTNLKGTYVNPPKYRVLTKYDGKLESVMTFNEEIKNNKITELRKRCLSLLLLSSDCL